MSDPAHDNRADPDTAAPAAERPSALNRLGVGLVSFVAALSAALGWWYGLTLIPAVDEQSLTESTLLLAWRSLVAGGLFGLGTVGVQLVRIVRARASRLPSTCAVTAGSVVVTKLSGVVAGDDAAIVIFALTSSSVLCLFSIVHVFAFVARWTSRQLRRASANGHVAKLLSAASLLWLTPFCAAPIAGDELAQLAEPAETLDERDLEHALGLALTPADEAKARDCLETLAPYRKEAVGAALWSAQLSHADAEDVVGSVLLAVCIPPKVRRELKPYFFRAVQNRAKDPARRQARRPFCPLCPNATSDLPPPDLTCDELWVRERIERLPERLATVIVLHDLYGFTLSEIASRLTISKSEVQRRRAAGISLLEEEARRCGKAP